MTATYCIVLCTCPDQETADRIAHHVIELKLVACTNIIADLSSIYFWEGKITQGSELCLVMKTRQDKLTDLEKAVLQVHPYQVPEFIALPIIYGSAPYLQWIDEVVI